MRSLILSVLIIMLASTVGAVSITIGDESTLDWGIDPENWDWDPDPGIFCSDPNPEWRDSGGGPIFDEYQLCFYDDGTDLYFLKILGMPPEGLIYDDPWNRGKTKPNWPKGDYRLVTGDLMLDFCSTGTPDCAIPIFTRQANPNYITYPWGSFDLDDTSQQGEVYCGNNLEFYCPQNVYRIGRSYMCPNLLAKGNETNKVADLEISYFNQSEVPNYILTEIFTNGKKYPYGNWMVPLPYGQRSSITQQQMVDTFDIFAVEIKVDKSSLTNLYPSCTSLTLKETPTCGNNLIAEDFELLLGPGGVEVPEMDVVATIGIVLLIPFVLLAISYRKGTLFKHHKHLAKIVKSFKKGGKK